MTTLSQQRITKRRAPVEADMTSASIGAAQADTLDRARAGVSRSPIRATRELTVLIVHPIREIVTSISRELRGAGHAPIELGAGDELLCFLTDQILSGRLLPDVIIAAAEMRGLGGVDLLSGLRGTSWEVPVVLLASATDGPQTWKRIEEVSPSALVHWPLDMRSVVAIVEAADGHARSQKSTYCLHT